MNNQLPLQPLLPFPLQAQVSDPRAAGLGDEASSTESEQLERVLPLVEISGTTTCSEILLHQKTLKMLERENRLFNRRFTFTCKLVM